MKNKFKKCIYGGGEHCARQGGNGGTHHGHGYLHMFPMSMETKIFYKAVEANPEEQEKTLVLPGMEDAPDDNAEVGLEAGALEETIPTRLYYFDLETEEGISQLITLLPILDDDIVAEVYSTIWPGYPTNDKKMFNDRTARYEIKGYLMDYLSNNNLEKKSEKPAKIHALRRDGAS